MWILERFYCRIDMSFLRGGKGRFQIAEKPSCFENYLWVLFSTLFFFSPLHSNFLTLFCTEHVFSPDSVIWETLAA